MSMRVYVPAVLSDLSVPLPPVRSGVLCVPEAAMSGEDIEVLEDDAITEAALSSLALARETEGAGEAVATLWESSLAWFDRSERPAVLALHKG